MGSLKDRALIIGLSNKFPLHTPHDHITEGLFTAAPFTYYIMSSYHEKITRDITIQKHNFKRQRASKQASKPDMVGLFYFSDQEFKTTKINTLRALWIK